MLRRTLTNFFIKSPFRNALSTHAPFMKSINEEELSADNSLKKELQKNLPDAKNDTPTPVQSNLNKARESQHRMILRFSYGIDLPASESEIDSEKLFEISYKK